VAARSSPGGTGFSTKAGGSGQGGCPKHAPGTMLGGIGDIVVNRRHPAPVPNDLP